MKRRLSPCSILLRLAVIAVPMLVARNASAYSNEISLFDAFAGENEGVIRFPVVRRNPEGTTSIRVFTSNGSPNTYQYGYILVEFAEGETNKEAVVNLIDNADVDGPPRTVELTYNGNEGGGNVVVVRRSATGYVADDEGAASTLTLVGSAGIEGEPSLEFHLIRQGPATMDVTGSVMTRNGSAFAGSDYVAHPAAVMLPAGSRFYHFPVDIIDDSRFEQRTETFYMDASGMVGASPASLSAAATIRDDDSQPNFILTMPGPISEGDGTVALTVLKTGDSDVTSTISLSAGTRGNPYAINGEDYLLDEAAQYDFAPDEIQKIIDIPIIDDAVGEDDETMSVYVSSQTFPDGTSGYPGSFANASTFIWDDDDSTPTLSIEQTLYVSEADGAATPTLTLSKASGRAVTLDYHLSDPSGVTPTYGGDGQIMIPSGTRTVALPIPFPDDPFYEAQALLTVTITAAENALIGPANTSEINVTDDDERPYLIADEVTVAEDAGKATVVVHVVGRSPGDDYCFDSSAFPGSADNGDADLHGGTFCIHSVAEVSRDYSITDDMLDEDDETFTVRVMLYNYVDDLPTAYVDVPVHILDNDATPSVSLSGTAGTEGGEAQFSATLEAASGRVVAVDLGLMPGTATAGSDFDSTTRTLVFAPGETYTEVFVPLAENDAYEETETFTGKLVNPREATIDSGQWGLLIADNDSPPTISVEDVSASEADGKVEFTLTKTGETEVPVQVAYRLMSISATAGDDYTDTSGTLTIAPSETTLPIAVTVANDSNAEADETFEVLLENPHAATITDGMATGTIVNDDPFLQQDLWQIK